MRTEDAEWGATRVRELLETMRAFAEAATDYQLLLDTVAERATRFMGEGCTIFLASDDGEFLQPAAIYNSDGAAKALVRDAFSALPLRRDGRSFAAFVMRTGEVALAQSIDVELVAKNYSPETPSRVAEALAGAHFQSFLCVPLEVRDRRFGVLALSRHRAGGTPFGKDDEAFARTLANHAALAISNAMLVEAQKRELVERRRAEEETKKFVALVQHSRDLIAMAGFDGRVLFVNDAGRKLLGIPADMDASEIPLAEFHTDEGMQRAPILKARGHWEGEGHLRHFKSRELIPTQISSFLLKNENGEPFGYATVQRDLRETRLLEEHLRQVQKMEAVGRLAGGVAHDFNNLLSVILSYSGLLVESLPEDSPFREDSQEIHRAGERAAALTQQLLAFSRQQVLEPRVVDLNDVLREMGKLLERLLGEHVELTTTFDAVAPKIKVDAGQLEQVIVNLAVNARDAMANGGTLTIATSNEDREEAGAAARTGVKSGRYVVLTVTDSGEGIDDSTLSRIFEPFFTTKPKGKGTGLGLATVFGIVKQSGGQITVASTVGRGTTFKVHFPVSNEVRSVAPAIRLSAAPVPRAEGTVLLVEDDEQVRTLMHGVLTRAGYVVLDARGPTEAVGESERFAGRIDLLVTDVVMPKMNGHQLAARVSAHRPDTKVLYVSGYGEDAIVEHGDFREGTLLLKKPITPARLLERVREVLLG